VKRWVDTSGLIILMMAQTTNSAYTVSKLPALPDRVKAEWSSKPIMNNLWRDLQRADITMYRSTARHDLLLGRLRPEPDAHTCLRLALRSDDLLFRDLRVYAPISCTTCI
jgi:hypothetical protein